MIRNGAFLGMPRFFMLKKSVVSKKTFNLKKTFTIGHRGTPRKSDSYMKPQIIEIATSQREKSFGFP